MSFVFVMTILLCSLFAGCTKVKPIKVAQTDVLRLGKQVYVNNCRACHGEHGDGKGPASFAIPGNKPRDFKKADFKYGKSPEALLSTINKGIPPVMPSWEHLPEKEKAAVIQYIIQFRK